MVLGLSVASPILHLKKMLDVPCFDLLSVLLTFVFAVAAEIVKREGSPLGLLGERCGEECGLVVYDGALDTRSSSVNLGLFKTIAVRKLLGFKELY